MMQFLFLGLFVIASFPFIPSVPPLPIYPENGLDHIVKYPVYVKAGEDESVLVDSPKSWRDSLGGLVETKSVTVNMEVIQPASISGIEIQWSITALKIYSIKVSSSEDSINWSFPDIDPGKVFLKVPLSETVKNKLSVVMKTNLKANCLDEQGLEVYGPNGKKLKIDRDAIEISERPGSKHDTLPAKDKTKWLNEVDMEVKLSGSPSIDYILIEIKRECLVPDIYLSIGNYTNLKGDMKLFKKDGNYALANITVYMPEPVQIDKSLNFTLDASLPIGEWRIEGVHPHGTSNTASSYHTTSSSSQTITTESESSTGTTTTSYDTTSPSPQTTTTESESSMESADHPNGPEETPWTPIIISSIICAIPVALLIRFLVWYCCEYKKESGNDAKAKRNGSNKYIPIPGGSNSSDISNPVNGN